MDALLGFSAGVMIAASFWSLLNPAVEMANSLKMNSTFVVFLGFFSGGLLLFIGDKIYNKVPIIAAIEPIGILLYFPEKNSLSI